MEEKFPNRENSTWGMGEKIFLCGNLTKSLKTKDLMLEEGDLIIRY